LSDVAAAPVHSKLHALPQERQKKRGKENIKGQHASILFPAQSKPLKAWRCEPQQFEHLTSDLVASVLTQLDLRHVMVSATFSCTRP